MTWISVLFCHMKMSLTSVLKLCFNTESQRMKGRVHVCFLMWLELIRLYLNVCVLTQVSPHNTEIEMQFCFQSFKLYLWEDYVKYIRRDVGKGKKKKHLRAAMLYQHH